MDPKNIQNLPAEIQIEFIKSLIRETCYEGFRSICSVNSYFQELCKENINSLRPELNKCILRKRFIDLNFDPKGLSEDLIDYIANKLTPENRKNLINSLSVLRNNNFPFVHGDSAIFIKNASKMTIDERNIFVSFLINLLQNLQRFTPFILQISELPISHSKKEYLLNLSCNLIGVNKVLEKIILNPDLNLSEPFLDFFVKSLKFSVDKYIQQLDLMITGLQEEINMISNPEDQQIMEEEYGPIIQKLENRMQSIRNAMIKN